LGLALTGIPRPTASAQEGCESDYYYGAGISGTGYGNAGTGGTITIAAGWNVNDYNDAFIDESVWIASGDQINIGAESSEGGVFIGWAQQFNSYQSFWSYYQTINAGSIEADYTGMLYPDYSYSTSVWFEDSSYFGTTTAYFAGVPGPGSPGPNWFSSLADDYLWSGAFQNWAQGETDSTCGSWSNMIASGLMWTPDGYNWYWWGGYNPIISYTPNAPPPYVSVTPYSNTAFGTNR